MCVEFDGESWRKRRWIEVYSLLRRAFLVEHNLVLAERKSPEISERVVQWPAIVSRTWAYEKRVLVMCETREMDM